MRIAGWLGSMGLGLVLACSDVPPQLEMPTAGDGAISSTTTGDEPTSSAPSDGTGSVADGSGSATDTGQGATTDPDGGTTQGVQPGTSTGTGDGDPSSTGDGDGDGDGDERGESSSGAPSPSCDELYGEAPGYVPCVEMETETECPFSAQVNGTPCNDICMMYGGTCIAAYDNEPHCVILNNNDSCENSNGHNTELCVCSK